MLFPEFIASAVEQKNTSIGSNKAFKDKTVSIPTNLLVDRYEEIIASIKKVIGYVPSVDDALSLLSKRIKEAMELERPIRDQLEKLCKLKVNTTLGVPKETIILDCTLVDDVKPDMDIRIRPEGTTYQPEDLNDSINDEILKRRLINSMVQGISYLLMIATYKDDKIKEWNPELIGLYREIICLNDFLLFVKEEEITDKNPMLGSHVKTMLGNETEKTIIESQGLVYPLLLQETYRGFFELFASNALPDDVNKAKFIISKADITIAEAWDLRLGVGLWKTIDEHLPDNMEPTIYPYIFSAIVIKPLNDFNDTIYDAMTNGYGFKRWANDVINQVNHDREYQLFKKDIEKTNLEKSLITDSCGQD